MLNGTIKHNNSTSAIGQHLLNDFANLTSYNDNIFSAVNRGRSTYHLRLESLFIKIV